MEELLGNIVIIIILLVSVGFIAYGFYHGAVLPIGKPYQEKNNDEVDEVPKED